MTDSTTLFDMAQLAEAAYADLWDDTTNSVFVESDDVAAALIAAGFSEDPVDPTQSAQAAAFVTQWEVVSHQPNTDSGFSATLFRNRLDGRYVYATRGTEGSVLNQILPDLLSTDFGDIVTDGVAIKQIVDMYNDWLRITTDADETYQAAYLEKGGYVHPLTGAIITDPGYAGEPLVFDTIGGIGAAYTVRYDDSSQVFAEDTNETYDRRYGLGLGSIMEVERIRCQEPVRGRECAFPLLTTSAREHPCKQVDGYPTICSRLGKPLV